VNIDRLGGSGEMSFHLVRAISKTDNVGKTEKFNGIESGFPVSFSMDKTGSEDATNR
jgi:hypothetical protein